MPVSPSPSPRVLPGELPRGALAAAAAGLAVVALLAWAGSEPPAARVAEAPAEAFGAARAEAVLRRLLAPDGGAGAPHPVGSPAGRGVRARLVAELDRLGLEPEVSVGRAVAPFWGQGARVENVVARLPGREPGPGVVLLAAHYDSVPAGPGASDDGAGAAAVVEVARALAAGPRPRRTVAFLITDGEEAGLLAARAFVAGHPLARDPIAVVNLEARGTAGPSYMFETSRENAALVELFAEAAPRPVATSLFPAVYERMPNDTDLSVFLARPDGVPAYNFAFIDGVWRYHPPLDDLDHLDRRSLQHHGDNALALARALADVPEPEALRAPGRSVFFDVLGAVVVRWPAPWSPALDAAAGEGRWHVTAPLGGAVPSPLAAVARLGPDLARPYPWALRPTRSGPPEPARLPAPSVEVLADAPTPDGRRVRLRLRSGRAAPVVRLLLPPGTPLRRATLAGVPLDPPPSRRYLGGWTHLAWLSTPPGGVEVVLDLAGRAPVEAVVADESYDLPPAGAVLRAARPAYAVPIQSGDGTVVTAPAPF